MGIRANMAMLMLQEHRYRPIVGGFLSIGRQLVMLSVVEAERLVRAQLGTLHPRHFLQSDAETRHSKAGEHISDRSFYSLFSDLDYACLDVSAYEGATILWDLCDPIPAAWEARYEFIFDGGNLDNIFDSAMAIRNLARLLKPGGRIMHINRLNRVHHIYQAFSLAWFNDFYAINDFADCKVYLALWDEPETVWDLYHYNPWIGAGGDTGFFGQDHRYDPHREAHAVVIAEKAAGSTWYRNPVQFQYRAPIDPAVDPYRGANTRFNASPRPVYAFAGTVPPQHSQYVPCGAVRAI
jgi:hypothetical protein